MKFISLICVLCWCWFNMLWVFFLSRVVCLPVLVFSAFDPWGHEIYYLCTFQLFLGISVHRYYSNRFSLPPQSMVSCIEFFSRFPIWFDTFVELQMTIGHWTNWTNEMLLLCETQTSKKIASKSSNDASSKYLYAFNELIIIKIVRHIIFKRVFITCLLISLFLSIFCLNIKFRSDILSEFSTLIAASIFPSIQSLMNRY